jgi:hypothetical protein
MPADEPSIEVRRALLWGGLVCCGRACLWGDGQPKSKNTACTPLYAAAASYPAVGHHACACACEVSGGPSRAASLEACAPPAWPHTHNTHTHAHARTHTPPTTPRAWRPPSLRAGVRAAPHPRVLCCVCRGAGGRRGGGGPAGTECLPECAGPRLGSQARGPPTHPGRSSSAPPPLHAHMQVPGLQVQGVRSVHQQPRQALRF